MSECDVYVLCVCGGGEPVVANLATAALLTHCEFVINTFSLQHDTGRGYGKDDAFKTAGFDLSVFVAREAGKEHRAPP